MGALCCNMESVTPVPIRQDRQDEESKVLEKFHAFARKYKIQDDCVEHYRRLRNVKVVGVLDDSNSMNSEAYVGDYLTKAEREMKTPVPSRFDELRSMVRLILEFARILPRQRMSVYFLNRGNQNGLHDISSMEQLADLFEIQSNQNCLTPLVRTLQRVIQNEQETLTEGNLLIYILTDGLNSNDEGKEDVGQMDAYLDVLMKTYRNLYITFVACVSQEELLQSMDKYAKMYPRVGVVDQFRVEMNEQNKKHAEEQDFSFTMGDLLTKLALVSLVPQVKEKFNDDDDEGKTIEGEGEHEGERERRVPGIPGESAPSIMPMPMPTAPTMPQNYYYPN